MAAKFAHEAQRRFRECVRGLFTEAHGFESADRGVHGGLGARVDFNMFFERKTAWGVLASAAAHK